MKQGCRRWGALAPSPPVFGRTVNPISTVGADYANHSTMSPQILGPCDGPEFNPLLLTPIREQRVDPILFSSVMSEPLDSSSSVSISSSSAWETWKSGEISDGIFCPVFKKINNYYFKFTAFGLAPFYHDSSKVKNVNQRQGMFFPAASTFTLCFLKR